MPRSRISRLLAQARFQRPTANLRANLRAKGLAFVAICLLAACGGERDSGTVDLTKGVGGLFGGRRVAALAAGTAAQGGVLINEVHAANWKGDVDEDGDAEDWLELYNPATAEVDLSGYGLTNNTRSPFRWAFPSGLKIGPQSYLRVWLSKKNRSTLGQPLHASFNLDNGGDSIFLSASDGTATGILIDSTKPALVKPDHSWCRMPSGQASSVFQICAQPTAGATNAGAAFASMLAKPQFSVPSGLYAAAQTVTVTGPAGATIRYTTDGSMPSEASPAYTGPVSVTASQALRAAAFGTNSLSSPAESQTYIIDSALAQRYSNLKTVFAVMDPADLARFQAREETLEALVNVEMLDAGTLLFKQDANGSVSGNLGSVNSPQVSMNLNAKDVFGPKDFVSTGVLWTAKPTITTTKKLRLRNGGNDWDRARLRDALAQDLASAGPNIVGVSTPVVMFMNGRYYGHMNLREREDETSVADNLGVDKDYVDFLENPPGLQIKNGGLAALNGYRRSNDFIMGNDMSVPANFERAKREVDLASLAWDWGHHLLMGNDDWPHNNVFVYRSPELGNRWAWRPHDFDFAFGRYAGPEKNMSGSYTAVNSQMFMSLMRHPEFRDLFLNVAADQMNLMTPTFMNARLDATVAGMRPYINDLFVANGQGGESTWEANLAPVRSWIKLREPFHDQHLRAQFNLSNRGAIAVAINDRSMGTVHVNTLDIGALMGSANAWSGRYYAGIPVSLEAKPRPGFVFVGWQGANTSTVRKISHTIASSPSLPADGFAVRWSGQLVPPSTGAYRFQLVADDGVALVINGQTLVSQVDPRAETTTTTTSLNLTAGLRANITVQYADMGGTATARLLWLPPGAREFVPIPATQFYPDAGAPYPTGLFAAYYNNTAFSGQPVATAIEAIDFAWGMQAPTPSNVEFQAIFAPGPVPAAPSMTAVAAQSARTGDLVNLPIIATDANGHSLSFSATGLPRGVNINNRTGIVFGRLTTPGVYNAVITASNGPSRATLAITWTVTDRPGTNTAPPTVTLTSPGAPQSLTLGSTLTLSASASDARGSIARVEFFEGNTRIGTVTSPPYSLGWTPTAAGTRSITAVATNSQGASTTSAAVAVTVQAPAANVAPQVALTRPLDGQVVSNGASVTVAASASDADGTIARVDFYDGSALIGSRAGAPFEWTVSLTVPGVHNFTALAVDNRGASTRSAVAKVLVAAGSTVPLPAGAVACATEGNFCALPAGRPATVFFGSSGHFFARTGQSGTIACSSATFGDPITGVTRACHYLLTDNSVTSTPGVLSTQYWPNRELTGTPAATALQYPNLNLSAVQTPRPGLPLSGFSVRWSGSLTPVQSGTHRFALRTSLADGVRLWVNGALLVDNWSAPRTSVEARINLVAGQPVPIRIEFYDAAGEARMALTWRQPSTSSFSAIPESRFSTATPAGTAQGLRGEYFTGTALGSQPPLVRIEAVDFDWGVVAPSETLPADRFSVRWTGFLVAPTGGSFQFQTVSDDGTRLWVNNRSLIDNWTTHARTRDTSASVLLAGGERVPIQLEYFEESGSAEMRLRWRAPGSSSFVPVPLSALRPS